MVVTPELSCGLFRIALYSNVHIELLDSFWPKEALLVRLAPSEVLRRDESVEGLEDKNEARAEGTRRHNAWSLLINVVRCPVFNRTVRCLTGLSGIFTLCSL